MKDFFGILVDIKSSKGQFSLKLGAKCWLGMERVTKVGFKRRHATDSLCVMVKA